MFYGFAAGCFYGFAAGCEARLSLAGRIQEAVGLRPVEGIALFFDTFPAGQALASYPAAKPRFQIEDQPAGLWQGMQSFDPGTFPLSAGRAAIALSWQRLQFR